MLPTFGWRFGTAESPVATSRASSILSRVSAESLYEAVARGLAALREADWAAEIGHGQTTVRVVVKQLEVEHTVRMRDFEAWLESNGRSPAEMALKSRLCQLLAR